MSEDLFHVKEEEEAGPVVPEIMVEGMSNLAFGPAAAMGTTPTTSLPVVPVLSTAGTIDKSDPLVRRAATSSCNGGEERRGERSLSLLLGPLS